MLASVSDHLKTGKARHTPQSPHKIFPLRLSKVSSAVLTQSVFKTGQGMEIVLGNTVTQCLSAPGPVRENFGPMSVRYW